MKVIRIEREGMTTRRLLNKVWIVKEVDAYGVKVFNADSYPALLTSRPDGFWDRWSLYEEPNDTLKQMI